MIYHRDVYSYIVIVRELALPARTCGRGRVYVLQSYRDILPYVAVFSIPFTTVSINHSQRLLLGQILRGTRGLPALTPRAGPEGGGQVLIMSTGMKIEEFRSTS